MKSSPRRRDRENKVSASTARHETPESPLYPTR